MHLSDDGCFHSQVAKGYLNAIAVLVQRLGGEAMISSEDIRVLGKSTGLTVKPEGTVLTFKLTSREQIADYMARDFREGKLRASDMLTYIDGREAD